MAIPAKKMTFVATQSDGTKITLMLVGDEHMHYYLNVATKEKMLRGDNGDYYPMDETTFNERKAKGDEKRKLANAERVKRLNARRAAAVDASGMHKVGAVGGMFGKKKGLVILVNFRDVQMLSGHTQSVFNDMFNKEGYSENSHVGSVHDYFYDQSYGQFDLSFDVVGPVTVANNMSYYGGNDRYGNDKAPETMISEACRLADSAVNFADYDWDGDGNVDQVFVIYAGYGENASDDTNTIWPHEYALPTALTLDGVKVSTYACSCELSGESGSTLNGIGTACHEFSHCLGYPDFYDTDYSGGFGMSAWDLMDGGSYNGPNYNGEVPSGFTSYERWIAGWLTPTELTEAKTIRGMKPIGEEPEAYILYNDRNKDEYILFENRQSSSKWFKYIEDYAAPSGLLAIHVDYNAQDWYKNTPNDAPSHQRMSIIPANKTYGTKEGYGGQSYWITSAEQFRGHVFGNGSTYLTDTSHANYGGKWFTQNTQGSYNLSHALSEISLNGGNIDFLFDGGGVEDDGSRYTVTFNAGSGSCGTGSWTQSDFLETYKLPKAYLPDGVDGWTHIGWTDEVIDEATQTKPSNIYSVGSYYLPEKDVTLFAVYKKGEDTSANNSYVLDYSAETGLQSKITKSYGSPVTYTAKDGGEWIVKAYKNAGMQINKGKDASIKVPVCSSPITSIEVTDNMARILNFSSTDYTGGNNPTAVASSVASTSAVINLEGKNLNTGYIYTTAGSTVISKIVVNYEGTSATAQYSTFPTGSTAVVTPTVSFPASTKSMLVGDVDDTFLATVEGSTGAVSYESSNPEIASVGPKTGRVVAHWPGSAKITATVAAVEGVSKSASASYTVNVAMPTLAELTVSLPKTTYWEGETIDTTDIVVKAHYENGYKADVKYGLTFTPSLTTALTTDNTELTITYTEDGVTQSVSIPITVNAHELYTVSFSAAGGMDSSEPITETEYNAGVVLPSAKDMSEEWKFAGWTTAEVAATTTAPTIYVAGSTYSLTQNTTLYAVYSLTESGGGTGEYKLVDSELTDWSGEYLIACSDDVFADGRKGGQKGIGGLNSFVAPGDNLQDDVVSSTWGDMYHVSLLPVEGGYVMKTQDDFYNYRTSNDNGIDSTKVIETAAKYPITVSFVSNREIVLKSSSGASFRYNDSSNCFRYYKSSNTTVLPIYLYKKQGTIGTTTYATTPSVAPLVQPIIAFAESSVSMEVGDKVVVVASAEGSTGAISYSVSDGKVASIDKVTGEVTALAAGTTTITAFLDAVPGESKSATATLDLIVTMPALASIEIAAPADKTQYNEGEALTIDGLALTATYDNGYTQTIESGFTTTPEVGTPLSPINTSVTVEYTEGDVTKSVSYDITVAELPKYSVTFVINGEETTVAQSIANTGIATPDVEDVTVSVNGEEVVYSFLGWSLTDVETETTDKQTLVKLADGTYTPTSDVTLYAVYVRSEGKIANGFTLSMENDGSTMYVGAANSGSQRFDVASADEDAITLYYAEGSLWYVDGSNNNRYVGVKAGKAELTFTTTQNTEWEFVTNENGTVSLSHPADFRYLGFNSQVSYFRAYLSTYPHEFNITYTGDICSLGSVSYFTSHPVASVPTVIDLVRLINKLQGDEATSEDVDKMVDKILDK